MLTKTKRSLLKEMNLVIQPIQVRSLILSCVYLTLENNPDLNNYIFNIQTIQMHRLTRSFIESKKLKDESIEYLPQFIHRELKYLHENQLIEQKKQEKAIEDGQPQIYKIYRKFFIDIEQKILGIIHENVKKGTMLNQIVVFLNRDLLKFTAPKNDVINQNLVQKILRKFIQEGKIYKTSQKVLYPNL